MGSSQSHPGDNRASNAPSTRGSLPSPEVPSSRNVETAISKAASSELQPRLATSRPVREITQPSLPPISAPTSILQHPALKFGAYSAGAGLVFGSFNGIIQGQSRVIISAVSMIQWGVAGTCFSSVRSLALDQLGNTRETRLSATTLASAVAGGAGTAISGRRPVVPGALISAMLGLGGQWLWDWSAERKKVVGEQTWLEWITRGKYSPLKMLTDQEYKEMLEEKLIKVEAEIAVLEDDIRELKEKDSKTER